LSPLEREVHRLWLVEGLSFQWVRTLARPAGPPLDDQELLDAIERIREVRGSDLRRDRRLEGLSGAPSLPRREYLAYLLELQSELSESRAPETEMAREELGRTIDWLKSRIGDLPDADRELLRLRFGEGLTAQSIAKRLGAPSTRSVFTWMARVLRQLRADLERCL
jgi:DNA-directed RNA polymerase specialized sigma24 family protein